jgi:hypothetical protein
MIKKELTELCYSRKSLILVIAVFGFFIYIGRQILSNLAINDFYLLAIMTSWSTNQFVLDSILSDKRNQTLEIMLVSGKIGLVFLAKMITLLFLSLVPFVIIFCFFMINGHNILPTFFYYVMTPLLFWLGACSAMMIIIFFNDEKSASFYGLISVFFIIAVIRMIFYLNSRFTQLAGIVFLVLLSVLFTWISQLLFKQTKIFLKNL